MSAGALLPPDDAQRASLHNEVHARPTARVRVPALMVYVAVDNRGISREDEWAHLRRLPGQGDLAADSPPMRRRALQVGCYRRRWP